MTRFFKAVLILTVLSAGTAGAQGRCGGANAGTANCDTMPAKLPFAPTGWKTVALDHFTMDAADYKKEVAYYGALMNWKLRSDDGSKAVMDMGEVGTVVIRGGYQPAPLPPAPIPTAADSAAGRAGRGGGARQPVRVAWSSFCWVISPWNAKNVEAALKSRGLNPVADNDGAFESFHVKDPDGFDVQISNDAHMKSRSSATATNGTPAPFANTNWQTVWLDHISFGVSNYKESAAFYIALLGWKPTGDEGSQNELQIGDIGNIIVRGGNPASFLNGVQPPRRASIGHISLGLQPWDADKVKAELDQRGLNGRVDTGGKGDIHESKYQSYHTTTPNGFDLQISNITRSTREVR